MEAAEARPAYVTFEVQAIEDRDATIKKGHYVSKDIDFAYITPAGSKDRVMRRVNEWLEQMEQQVKEERLPASWYESYKAQYGRWKSGQEIPQTGTAVKNWPALSPSQVNALLGANLRTIEDVAAANEQALAMVGMGARALKQLAIEWLASAKDTGQQAEEIAALRVANQGLAEANKELGEKLAALANRLSALEK